jgi:GNAT superfamily N-acetyltransferase
MYRIRRVDNTDEEVVHEIRTLHDATFGDTAPQIEDADFDEGWWWLASFEKEAIAFAGLLKSHRFNDCGYLCRVGVMPIHRGQGLQHRLIRVREAQAKRNGWAACITDTTDNVASANSLIRAGYRLYVPKEPWAMSTTLYWRRWL